MTAKEGKRANGELFFWASPATFHYAVDVGDGWVAAMHFASDDGIVSLTEYGVHYAPDTTDLDTWLAGRVDVLPPAGAVPRDRRLTVRKLRQIKVGQIEAAARSVALSPLGQWALPTGWAADAQPPVRNKGGREQELTDLMLVRLAATYVELLSDPAVTSPVEVLAADLNLSKSTVRNRLAEARRRLLLSSAGQGRAGGAITNKGRDILDGER